MLIQSAVRLRTVACLGALQRSESLLVCRLLRLSGTDIDWSNVTSQQVSSRLVVLQLSSRWSDVGQDTDSSDMDFDSGTQTCLPVVLLATQLSVPLMLGRPQSPKAAVQTHRPQRMVPLPLRLLSRMPGQRGRRCWAHYLCQIGAP